MKKNGKKRGRIMEEKGGIQKMRKKKRKAVE